MTLDHVPAVAFMDPAMWNPPAVRALVLPVASNPLMTSTVPGPVTAQPHVTGSGCGAVYLDSRRGRGCLHYRADVISAGWRGGHYASGEDPDQHRNCYQPDCTRVHIHSTERVYVLN